MRRKPAALGLAVAAPGLVLCARLLLRSLHTVVLLPHISAQLAQH